MVKYIKSARIVRRLSKGELLGFKVGSGFRFHFTERMWQEYKEAQRALKQFPYIESFLRRVGYI